MRELRQRGWQVRDLALPAGFPRPDERALVQSDAMLAAVPDGCIVVIDQLCLGVMPDVAKRHARRLQLVMIVHHPLARETGISDEDRQALVRSEREALAHVALAVVTSPTTARDLLENFGIGEDRIVVAVPGVDERPIVMGSGGDPLLLSVGAVVPRKDHATLIAALAGLVHLPWRLKIVGNLTRAPDHVGFVQSLITRHGLSERVALSGELDDAALEQVWIETDLYVAASRHEGFGMALSEAIARGVPVVATAAGAVSDWLSEPAAILVETGNIQALKAGLSIALSEPEARVKLRHGALGARRHLQRWHETAANVEAALAGLASNSSRPVKGW